MRTVGLIFYEETDTAPALAAGAEAAAAEAEARGAGKEDPAPAQEKAPEDMTVTELRSYAAAHGIDVTGAAKKQDLLLAVQTAVEPSAAPAEAVPGEQPETAAE